MGDPSEDRTEPLKGDDRQDHVRNGIDPVENGLLGEGLHRVLERAGDRDEAGDPLGGDPTRLDNDLYPDGVAYEHGPLHAGVVEHLHDVGSEPLGRHVLGPKITGRDSGPARQPDSP